MKHHNTYGIDGISIFFFCPKFFSLLDDTLCEIINLAFQKIELIADKKFPHKIDLKR